MDLKEFIETYQDKINTREFEEVYDSAAYKISYKNIGKLTELFYKCGVDPLKYMSKVPRFYAYESSIKSIVIPNNIVSMGVSTFDHCTSLTSVNIPDSVTEINIRTFYGCSSLTSITIPDSVTYIGWSAFEDCTSLTGVTIPDRVTGIGEKAFRNCTSLTSVTVGDSVQLIYDEAFRGCTSLKSINYKGSKNQWRKIQKYARWKSDSPLETIHCIDADITYTR